MFFAIEKALSNQATPAVALNEAAKEGLDAMTQAGGLSIDGGCRGRAQPVQRPASALAEGWTPEQISGLRESRASGYADVPDPRAYGAKLPVAIWPLIGFVQDVPKEIEESAAMDGAGTLRILLQIVTPLIAPGVGASAVITFLFTWNDLLIALTLASSENSQTLPVGLTNFISQYGVDWGAMSAAGVLMVIPTLIFVWFAQGLLVKGLVTGAVRG